MNLSKIYATSDAGEGTLKDYLTNEILPNNEIHLINGVMW